VRFVSSAEEPTMGKIERMGSEVRASSSHVSLVAATTIDALAERYGPPAVIKIDTEGAAGDVLAGASATARRFGPALLIELHDRDERGAVEEWVARFDYSMVDLNGRPVENLRDHHVSPLWCEAKSPRRLMAVAERRGA
jgi:hypothetical protein